jgi:hypothetical protein
MYELKKATEMRPHKILELQRTTPPLGVKSGDKLCFNQFKIVLSQRRNLQLHKILFQLNKNSTVPNGTWLQTIKYEDQKPILAS